MQCHDPQIPPAMYITVHSGLWFEYQPSQILISLLFCHNYTCKCSLNSMLSHTIPMTHYWCIQTPSSLTMHGCQMSMQNSIVQYLVNISSPVQQQMHCLNRSPFTGICEWGQSSLYQTHTSRIHMNKVYYSHIVNSVSDCASN